jgi:hypothetical protein
MSDGWQVIHYPLGGGRTDEKPGRLAQMVEKVAKASGDRDPFLSDSRIHYREIHLSFGHRLHNLRSCPNRS